MAGRQVYTPKVMHGVEVSGCNGEEQHGEGPVILLCGCAQLLDRRLKIAGLPRLYGRLADTDQLGGTREVKPGGFARPLQDGWHNRYAVRSAHGLTASYGIAGAPSMTMAGDVLDHSQFRSRHAGPCNHPPPP